MSLYKEKNKETTRKEQNDRVIFIKKDPAKINYDFLQVTEPLKIFEPKKRFETSLSMLEKFTGGVLEEIKNARKRPNRYWLTTLKDYLSATDSKLIRFVKVALGIVALGIGLFLAGLLLTFLIPAPAVSSGLIFPIFKKTKKP